MAPASARSPTTNSSPPVIANLDNDSVGWAEDLSGPVILDANALLTVTDADSADFDGGTLTLSVSQGAAAGEDVLSLANQPGSIELSGGNVLHNGIAIGTWAGGTNGAALVFTFNSAATPLGVTALMQKLTYDNGSQEPSISQREIEYVLTDGDGGSRTVHSFVTITENDDLPAIGNLHGDSVDWHVGDSPVLLDLGSNATVTDVDSPSLPDFELTVSSTYTGDVIGIADIGGVTHDLTDVYVDLVDIGDILIDGAAGTLQILLTGPATTEYVERLLRAVTITNTDPTPQLGAHLVQIRLFDTASFTSTDVTTTFNVLAPNLSVGDRVFFDADDSGGYSAGDTGLDGITIDLVAGNGSVVATTVTGGGGLYSFTGLAAGDYYLLLHTADLPAGYVSIPSSSLIPTTISMATITASTAPRSPAPPSSP